MADPTLARADRQLVLASASPSRLALLRTAGFDPEVIPSHASEDGVDHLSPIEAVRTLAERKATVVARRFLAEAAVVVGCDSMLDFAGEVRGKPDSVDQARAWWRSQRGRRGTLVTGHCVVDPGSERQASGVSQTTLHFGHPSDAEIEAYLATGEPLAVAGAVTIDGFGAPFVERIEGDHGTVIGLSLPLLRRLLGDIGIAITDLWRTCPRKPEPTPGFGGRFAR